MQSRVCVVAAASRPKSVASFVLVGIILALVVALSPRSAFAQAGTATPCARCQTVSAAGASLAADLRRFEQDRTRTLAQVERVDAAIASLTTSKDANERSVSQVLRERRSNRDRARLPEIEARLRRLSEETADLDRRLADELERKAQFFERITWHNAVIERLRSESQAFTRLAGRCTDQCLDVERGAARPNFARIAQSPLERLEATECADCNAEVLEVNNLVGQIEDERRQLATTRAGLARTEEVVAGADRARDASIERYLQSIRGLADFEARERRASIDAQIIQQRAALEQLAPDFRQVLERRSEQWSQVVSATRRIEERLEAYDTMLAGNRRCIAQCRGTTEPATGGRETGPSAGTAQRQGREPIATPDPNGGTDDGKSQDRLTAPAARTPSTADAAPRISPILPPEQPVLPVDEDVDLGRPQIARAPVRLSGATGRRPVRSVPRSPALPQAAPRERSLDADLEMARPHELRARIGVGEIDLPGRRPAGGDGTLGSWSVEVSGTFDASAAIGAVAIGEWEVRVIDAGDDANIAPAVGLAGVLTLEAPGGSILAAAGPGATPIAYDADYHELRTELRLGSPEHACLSSGAGCRFGLLAGLQLTSLEEEVLGLRALDGAAFSLARELDSHSALLGFFGHVRQPLGGTPLGFATLVLDADAFVKLGYANADAQLRVAGLSAGNASESGGFAGFGAEADLQIEFDLDGFLLAFGARYGIETDPTVAYDGAGGLDLGRGTREDALVYLEGKWRF
ncbi:MAG: hypothetical protein GC150_12795 [Rhizobiales bacterium]|nr:hypothetical protein [Hyphomicrobiales bacterium]